MRTFRLVPSAYDVCQGGRVPNKPHSEMMTTTNDEVAHGAVDHDRSARRRFE